MNCVTCGRVIPDGSSACPYCGAACYQTTPTAVMSAVYEQRPAAMPYQQPGAPFQEGGAQPFMSADRLPSQFRPLGAWEYFGYGILFSIPLIGFILLIVFSLSDVNINRRNYARSFFCWLAIAGILILLVGFLGFLGSPILFLGS